MVAPESMCPCAQADAKGRPLTYGSCCGLYIEDHLLAPNAQALMRSRYSAFVLNRTDYLQATWHVSTRPEVLDLESDVKWLGLDVRHHRVIDATHAEVEFVARSRVAGRGHRLHERSRFAQENGRWYYVDGDLF